MSRVGSGALAALFVGSMLVASSAAPSGAATHSTAATVEFRPVLSDVPPATPTSTTMAPANRVDAGVKIGICDVAGVAQLPVVPTTDWKLAKPAECVVYPHRDGGASAPRYFLGAAEVTKNDVKRARAQFLAGEGWTVRFDLTKAGGKAWDALAEQQFHQRIAVTFAGNVVAIPTVEPDRSTYVPFQAPIVISGNFTRRQAQTLAAAARGANGG